MTPCMCEEFRSTPPHTPPQPVVCVCVCVCAYLGPGLHSSRGEDGTVEVLLEELDLTPEGQAVETQLSGGEGRGGEGRGGEGMGGDGRGGRERGKR